MQKDKKVSILTNQFIRSGTDIGANIRQAFYAHGWADFIGKLQIALEKGSGSEYWLELLIESGYYHDVFIWDQGLGINKTLISSINTAKNNQKQQYQNRVFIPKIDILQKKYVDFYI